VYGSSADGYATANRGRFACEQTGGPVRYWIVRGKADIDARAEVAAVYYRQADGGRYVRWLVGEVRFGTAREAFSLARLLVSGACPECGLADGHGFGCRLTPYGWAP
jgi:hypothetical protein